MNKRTATYKIPLAALSVFLLAALLSAGLVAAAQQKTPQAVKGVSAASRADIVTVDRLGAGFDKRDKPQVTFLHDQHITALGEKGKDCATCHGTTERGYYDFVYKDSKDKTGAERKQFFHEACISCHQERAAAGESTGPQNTSNCASCHMGKLPFESNLKQVRMPLGLHALHSDAKVISPKEGEKDNCSVCHHTIINTETKELVLERGKEQGCFSCHFAAKSQDTERLDAVSHQACLTCHAKLIVEGKESGPTNCSVCHAVPLSVERKYADGPRLERGQPGMTFIFPKPAAGEPLPNTVMPPAVFDHAKHEIAADQCSTCHHMRIESCGNCHTLSGESRAGFRNQYQANHTQGAVSVAKTVNAKEKILWGPGETCNGCHQQQARSRTECAGCHSNPSLKMSTENCSVCHVPTNNYAGTKEAALKLAALSDSDKALVATRAAEYRDSAQVKVNLEDIPEFVNIAVLSKDYAPAKLPHRKIVKALLQPARADKLAYTFHMGDLRACSGCHHNSAPSLNPPACASCHPKEPVSGRVDLLPLQVAYHQQCMSCHNAMQILEPKDTDCYGCHAKREK